MVRRECLSVAYALRAKALILCAETYKTRGKVALMITKRQFYDTWRLIDIKWSEA